MRGKNKAGERLIILTCWVIMLIGGAAWLLLRSWPSVQSGVTLSLFGLGFLAVAWVEMKVEIAASERGAVYREDDLGRYWMLIIGKIITGIVLMGFAWYI